VTESDEFNARELELTRREEELGKRETALLEANSKLLHQEKMSSLGRLVAGIAHELNNPINFIYGNVEFLGEYFDALVKLASLLDLPEIPEAVSARVADVKKEIEYEYLLEDARKLLASIRSGAERTAAIVRDLRNYSHAGGIDMTEVDISSGIETTLNLIAPLIRGRIEIERRFDSPTPRVFCNAARLNQVFMNLLTNAAQAIPEAGTITIEIHNAPNDRLRISIRDTGSGIADEHIRRITDPFFTTKDVGEGTGLGLWICDSIVRAHGGTLTCESTLGSGSVFSVELPVRPAGGTP